MGGAAHSTAFTSWFVIFSVSLILSACAGRELPARRARAISVWYAPAHIFDAEFPVDITQTLRARRTNFSQARPGP